MESIEQQILDYICIDCMQDIFKRIGTFQIAGIPGRGTTYGVKYIKQWLNTPKIQYWVKCDIRKCYESVDQNLLKQFLHKYIKNKDLLWLLDLLLNTYEKGLNIGSLLSQFLCNLYLSQAYHYMKEDFKVNNHKLDYLMFQMDDILMIHNNKEELQEFLLGLQTFLWDLGFEVKVGEIYRCAKSNTFNINCKPVDLVGYQFYKSDKGTKVNLRESSWKRANRCFLRVKNRVDNHKNVSAKLARRFISLYGRLAPTDCYNTKMKYKECLDICAKIVSRDDKKKLYQRKLNTGKLNFDIINKMGNVKYDITVKGEDCKFIVRETNIMKLLDFKGKKEMTQENSQWVAEYNMLDESVFKKLFISHVKGIDKVNKIDNYSRKQLSDQLFEVTCAVHFQVQTWFYMMKVERRKR